MTFEEIREILIGGHLYHNGSEVGRIDNVETKGDGLYVVVINDIAHTRFFFRFFFRESEVLKMIEGEEAREARIWRGRCRVEIRDSARIKKLTSEFSDFTSLVEQMRKTQREYSESLGLTAPSETERLELEVDSFIEGWNKRMIEKGKNIKEE